MNVIFALFYITIKTSLKCTSHLLCSLTTIIYADKCWMNCIKNTIQITTHKVLSYHFLFLLFICLYITKNEVTNVKNDVLSPKVLRHNTE